LPQATSGSCADYLRKVALQFESHQIRDTTL
jgi:hypothetical protein